MSGRKNVTADSVLRLMQPKPRAAAGVLEGYSLVTPSRLGALELPCFIKYEDETGRLRSGGFLVKVVSPEDPYDCKLVVKTKRGLSAIPYFGNSATYDKPVVRRKKMEVILEGLGGEERLREKERELEERIQRRLQARVKNDQP